MQEYTKILLILGPHFKLRLNICKYAKELKVCNSNA
jgi:hypothetical protein